MNFLSRVFLPVVLLVPSAVPAEAWPQFRGPRASGVDASRALPVKWDIDRGENIRWRTPIPGLGHASPIVWEDRVYLATATGEGKADLKVGLYGDIASADDQGIHQWRLLALDLASGRIIWNTVGHEGAPRVRRHPKASHCNSTPATDGRVIAAIFGSEGLFCFDLDGRLAWKKDLGPMESAFFSSPTAQWGFASSPAIHDGKVIVLCDVLTNSFLAAFDRDTGKELWRTARADVPTWGTPTVVESPGRVQIAVNGWHHTGGYDLETGRELWRLDGGGDIPVPTPITAHGLIYQTSAHGRFRPMRAIRVDAEGDITPENPGATNNAIVWAHARLGNYMQTPIVVGDHLWACFDIGVVTCFNATNGEVQYSERLPTGQGYTASPVSDGRHLYFTSEMGSVYVVPATTSFSITATNELGETCMSAPAISRGTILFRTREHLVAVGERSD